MSENKRRKLLFKAPHAYLHNDLMVEIMSRVAAKSLLRFKSVSKQWKSIIEDPTFITLHHNRAHSRPDGGSLLISVPMPEKDGSDLLLFSAPYQGGPVSPLLPNHPQLKDYKANKSTHGLILLTPKLHLTLTAPRRPLLVFNPTTQELIPLPLLVNIDEYCKKVKRENPQQDIRLWVNCSFGFDPLTGVYKVLCRCTIIRFEPNQYPWEKIGSSMYYVFTLGTKEWRNLGTPNLPAGELAPTSACVNGAIYFKSNPHSLLPDNHSGKIHDFIVAFDVGTEKFRLVSPPRAPPMYQILELGGRLGLRENTNDNATAMWILEDHNQHKWIRVELQNPLEWVNGDLPYSIVGGVQSSNKFLLAPQNQIVAQLLWVYYYDKNGKEWSKFRITGLPDINTLPHAFLMTNNIETLFSPSADRQR